MSEKDSNPATRSGGGAPGLIHNVKFGASGKYIRIPRSAGDSRASLIWSRGLGDLVYVVYFVLGTGFLLPWNAFITAVDYFGYLYPDSHVDRTFSVAYLVPCLVVLCLLVACGQSLGALTKINWGLVLFTLSIVVVPITEKLFIDGKQQQHGNSWTYVVTVCAVAAAGVGDALVQGTLIGFAGRLPERFTQAIVCGTGFSGVLVSSLRIATKRAFPDNPQGLRASANVYFTVSAVFLVVCVLAYNSVHGIAIRMVCKDASEEEIMTRDAFESSLGSDVESSASGVLTYGSGPDETTIDNGGRDFHNHDPVLAGKLYAMEAMEKGAGLLEQTLRWTRVFLPVKWLAIAIAVTYVITLAIYPGFLTEEVTSAGLGDWYPVLLIGCYNLFDLAGKSLPAVYVPWKHIHALGWAAARLVFFPLYSACVHGPRAFRTETPVFVLTGLLGLTNGYLTTCFFLVAPKGFRSGSLDAETVGVVMVLALEVGLTLGSLVSWVV